jgi:YidC/Oxa1 family membrane protein insertase
MDFLTNPFTTALLFLYQILGQNIVLSIVVFTVLIRVLTYPLTYQQIKSSKAMQELQPKLKKLQEKHKGDREKLAQEQMRL